MNFLYITILSLFINFNVLKTETGEWTATYYGNQYKTEKIMANGEKFNVNALTCAAPKKIPFGTKLRITNLSNNKYVDAIVTDRGGFKNNVIDLTYGAFKKIEDNHRKGRIKIKVEIIK